MYFLDSLLDKKRSDAVCGTIVGYLRTLTSRNIRTQTIHIPQQQCHTKDCGLYVICVIEALIRHIFASDIHNDLDAIDYSNLFGIDVIHECRDRLKIYALKKVCQQYWAEI